MSKEELDALNESGRAWRNRNKPDAVATSPKENPPAQLDLWEKEDE